MDMWHSDKAYLPDVVEGTVAWAEKNDKIILDNNLIINPVTLKRIYSFGQLVISILWKKDLKKKKKSKKDKNKKKYLVKVISMDIDVYSGATFANFRWKKSGS